MPAKPDLGLGIRPYWTKEAWTGKDRTAASERTPQYPMASTDRPEGNCQKCRSTTLPLSDVPWSEASEIAKLASLE